MKTSTQQNPEDVNLARRSFLRYAGAGAATVALFGAASCKKDQNERPLDLGSGDVGVLNYAYALEQLEAAFYKQVTENFYSGATTEEKAILTDIYNHEVAHREFFKAALGYNNALPALTPDFSSINFSDRTSVLKAAKAFEDLGVAAYNGAGSRIQTPDYLVFAGKIVSVEARHAALIRDLLDFNSFVDNDVVDIGSTGLERSKSPAEVIPIANTFLSGRKLSASDFGM